MENFFYEDKFCSDVYDLIDELGFDDEAIQNLPSCYIVSVYEARLEKAYEITEDDLYKIMEHRLPEDFELKLDLNSINEQIPSFFYPTNVRVDVTKKDFLEYL